jgi:pimeloyl-ACP methyl ester carboxylesterase
MGSIPVLGSTGSCPELSLRWQRITKSSLSTCRDLAARTSRPLADAYGLQWIEDIALLLDQLNIRKGHIVGYSMGSIVALKLSPSIPTASCQAPSAAWEAPGRRWTTKDLTTPARSRRERRRWR